MLTFGMKIFIDLRDTYICGWLDLRLPVFAYLENCLGCTEVSRLPFPESLCMKCSHGKSWNERWKLAIYALTWFFLVQMGNSGQRYWIIDSPFKRLWVCVPQIFLLPVIKKVIRINHNILISLLYLHVGRVDFFFLVCDITQGQI